MADAISLLWDLWHHNRQILDYWGVFCLQYNYGLSFGAEVNSDGKLALAPWQFLVVAIELLSNMYYTLEPFSSFIPYFRFFIMFQVVVLREFGVLTVYKADCRVAWWQLSVWKISIWFTLPIHSAFSYCR